MSRRPWTQQEVARGKQLVAEGMPYRDVATELGRSHSAVKNQMSKWAVAQRGRKPAPVSRRMLEVLRHVVETGHSNSTRLSGRFGMGGARARRILQDMVAAGWMERQGPRGLTYLPTEKGRAVAAARPVEEPPVVELRSVPALRPVEPVPVSLTRERDKQARAFRRREEGHTWARVAELEQYPTPGDAMRAARVYAGRLGMPWPPVQLNQLERTG